MLVTKFDTNGDQKISLEEFVNFTLNIPHLTWRAERSRRRSGAPLTETVRRISAVKAGCTGLRRSRD